VTTPRAAPLPGPPEPADPAVRDGETPGWPTTPGELPPLHERSETSEPITVTGTFSAPAGPDGLAILYDVPPGKVLIVDDVSGGSLGPDDSSSIAVQLRGSKPDGAFDTVGWLHCNHDRWHGFGRQMRLYFFPGGVDALFRRDDDLSSWNGYVSLTGRLVDYPAL